jgi:hypothetical protein
MSAAHLMGDATPSSFAAVEPRDLTDDGSPQDAWRRSAALRPTGEGAAHLAERIRLAKAACARAESAGARIAHDEAEACYRRAVELAPDVPGFRIGWARALINAGRPGDAWPILAALRDSADTPDLAERIRRAMAACARKLGEAADAGKARDDAVAWHRTAAELVPDVPYFHIGWARALINAGRPGDAWPILAALRDSADTPDLAERIRRAMAACAKGIAFRLEFASSVEGTDWRQAARWREEALRHDPHDTLSWLRYAWDLIYCGRFADASAVVAGAPSPEIAAELQEHIGAMPRHLQAQLESEAFIFRAEAPKYHVRGLPVVPTLGKVPIPRDWQSWSDRLPEESEYQRWREIPWANIGLVLGPQSGVAVIDIDTDDSELTEVICSLLPRSPWHRVGRKGVVLAYRWTGLPTQCYAAGGERHRRVFDYLSAGAKIMLPPSLHPQTGVPYRANCELLDALDDLPALPPDFSEVVTAALRAKGCDVRLLPFPRQHQPKTPDQNPDHGR